MKGIIIFLLIVSLSLIGCEIQEDAQEPDTQTPQTWEDTPEPDIKTPPSDAECTANSDCTTGGCSGTLCLSKDSPPFLL